MKFGSTEATADSDIANMFADFFQNSYSTFTSTSNYSFNINRLNFLPQILLTEEEVLNGLKTLKNSISPGPDGVPANVLKLCAIELYIPLTKLFNYSLSLGYFPYFWRSSYIIPLHKTGSRCNIENYRGIAKLSAIPKLFEFLVSRRLTHFVAPIFSPCQHGFIRGRSTLTNLMELTCYVHNGFANKFQTDVIYTDFSKAFDTVVHSLLLHKLDLMGFPTLLLD